MSRTAIPAASGIFHTNSANDIGHQKSQFSGRADILLLLKQAIHTKQADRDGSYYSNIEMQRGKFKEWFYSLLDAI